jgi:3-deoxy-manno-octulosonate cytidylyltransferase (CMP-KDO synthetase)
MAQDFYVVVPARFASTRLPGKPLLSLAGKPLLQHAWERACESRAARVLVATDDERIERAARGFGAEVVMTSSAHPNGTCRLAEVAERLALDPELPLVNLQGDEPQVPGALIDLVAGALVAHPGAQLATLAAPIRSARELFNPNVVKVVQRADGNALYFSRAPIPWARDAFAGCAREQGWQPPDALPSGQRYLRHIGLYAYRAGVLARLAAAPPAPSEETESLEQLRALHMGLSIFVALSEQVPGHGVDTPDDLARLEAAMAAGAAPPMQG